MLFEPHKDNVFLLLDDPVKVTPGGLHVPNGVSEYGESKLVATVYKVGPGGYGYKNETENWTHFAMEVEAGERVVVEKDAGDRAIVGKNLSKESSGDLPDGTEFLVVRCSEILGVLE